MAELSLYNIDRITSDVKSEEIGFSHLFHDLVDHICCDVEYQMQQGLNFDEAYRIVKANIGYRGLKHIQEDTLYMVDTKYRNMKKLMKISGITGTIMLGFAAIFKIAHLPMAGIILSLGALILAFLFLPSALTVLWKETKSTKKLLLFISAFISGVAFILGMLLKIQHWPGAGMMISLGMLTGIFLFLPALLYQLFLDPGKKHKRLLYIAGALCVSVYSAGFWFRIMHWPLAGLLTISGAVLLIFAVFPVFTRVQWKNESSVNARFIFMVITSLLFIQPGALINLNLEKNYDDGFRTRLENQNNLIDLQKSSNIRFLELNRDSAGFHEMEIIHKAAGELIEVLYLPVNNMIGSALLQDSKLTETVNTKIADYRNVLSENLGNEWLTLYSPMLNPSDYLPRTDGSSGEVAMIPELNAVLTLASGILITESAALQQISLKR